MSSRKELIVSLHDAHPGSLAQVRAQRTILREAGVTRCSILVVPYYHHQGKTDGAAEFLAWCEEQLAQGDELVLHGYTHDRRGQLETWRNVFWTRFYTNAEAEFLDLPVAEAERRLAAGRALFQQQQWPLAGFIAPAWLLAPAHLPLLHSMGFTYTNTVRGLWLFKQMPIFIPSPSLCWSTRAAWRRNCSLLWNAFLHHQLKGTSLLRVSLHPSDFNYVTIRKQILRCTKIALEQGLAPITYAEYAAR
jgi:uncharacterized protein